jgi:hypothetical protein
MEDQSNTSFGDQPENELEFEFIPSRIRSAFQPALCEFFPISTTAFRRNVALRPRLARIGRIRSNN